MPDLDDLDRFQEGLPVMTLLPATEIRRRGDRLRRRRTALVATGGVLAVALAIGTPVIALSGSGKGHDLQPAPKPSPTEPAHRWVTEVLDFPIESRFPAPFERKTRVDGSELTPTCGPWFSGETVEQAVLTYTGGSEDQAQRWLILFEDQQAAESSMAMARQSVRMCPSEGISGPPGSGVTQVYAEVAVELGTEDSFAWTRQIRHDDGLISDLTYVQIAQTGNALYVESASGDAGGDEVVGQVRDLLTRRSAEPLSLMCVYAAEPCLDPYAPATQPPVGTGVSSTTVHTS